MSFIKRLITAGSAAVAVIVLGAAAPSASANSIVVTNNGGLGQSLGGGVFRYDLQLTFQNQLVAGDFFSLFDFEGLTGVDVTNLTSSVVGDFVATTPTTTPGVLNPTVAAQDDGLLPNVLITYTGTGIATSTVTGAIDLGYFLATTSLETFDIGVDRYVGDYTTSDGVTSDQNYGNAIVPVSAAGPMVPSPTAALGGAALIGGLALRRRSGSLA